MLTFNINEIARQAWLKEILTALPAGARLLDAGAGELKNRLWCGHLDYVSQDFCQYKGIGGGRLMKAYSPLIGTPPVLTSSATL